MHNRFFCNLQADINLCLEKFDEKIQQKLKDSEHKYSEPIEEANEATNEANEFVHNQLTGNNQ